MPASLARLFLSLALSATALSLTAQDDLPEPWVAYPSANNTGYGVYHYRQALDLAKVPEKLVVHISADMRYHFYVNGEEVCYGPAKGDLVTWKYDRVDLAPYLQAGDNVLAATVFNQGDDRAKSLFNIQTAFMLRAEDPVYARVNSGPDWKVYHNSAYQPVTYQEMLFDDRWFYGYYACGPGDRVDGALYPWGWREVGFDDSDWKSPEILVFEKSPPWQLVPRSIPFMDRFPVQPQALREVAGTAMPQGLLEGKRTWEIPAHTEASLIIDYEILTMGYPDLVVSGGAGSRIQVNYAEALYEEVNLKGHRDQVKGLTMFGVWDVFKPDGGERTFRPLWKRCFRYVKLSVETGGEPLEIIAHDLEFSGYPYPEMATFVSNDDTLNEIFEVCLWTLRMCSAETYYDTPYYEQLSYGGDNRPIAHNSIYNSTDDRLFREVMRLYPQSADNQTGLFDSAYPADWDLTMGSWSLAWIQTLNDYWKLRGDLEWVRQFVAPTERVLEFYEQHLNEQRGILGSIANLGWAEGNSGVKNFMDWSISDGSIPRREGRAISDSVLLTLYFLHTLQTTEELYRALGEDDRADHWQHLATVVQAGVREQGWNPDLGLFRDYPEREEYSQHAQILAILTDTIPPDQQAALMERVLTSDVFQEYASSYFTFFLFKALSKVDMEQRFLDLLAPWEEFIAKGFTTTGESGFASHDRSDCHAWAAHPSYYLLAYTCGILPGDIGFNTVRIEPHLGDIESVIATMPHPLGRIEVDYRQMGDDLIAVILLPDGLFGEFIHDGKTVPLQPGENRIGEG